MVIANRYNAEIIEHKEFIGGRYSVLSESGMFPAALMGLNIKKFKKLRDNKNKSQIDKQAYDNFIAQYPNSEQFFQIESTDGQEYTTWKEHLYVLEQLGKTKPGLIDTARLEKAKQLIESGKALKDMNAEEKELVKFVFQPIKPVYTGQIQDPNSTAEEVLYRAIYIKSSSIPLLPQMTEGTELDLVTIRFSGDSGDGMQLTGNQFTNNAAIFGNDISTLPDFPAEIRAPAGSLAGVSSFQLQFSSNEIYTPGDKLDVLVSMNPAGLKVNLRDLKENVILIINNDNFTKKNLNLA